MAVRQQSPVGEQSGTTTVCTLPSVSLAGSTIVVALAQGDSSAVSITDDKGNTYAAAPSSPYRPLGFTSLFVWYATNATAGAKVITMTLSGSGNATSAVATELTGVLTSSVLDTTALVSGGYNAGTASEISTLTAAATLAQANNTVMHFGAVGAGCLTLTWSSGTFTQGNSETDINDFYSVGTASKQVTSTTAPSNTMTATFNATSSGDIAGAMLVFKEASGGGTSLTPGAGSVTLTGPAPTVARTANQALTAGAGSLALTGPAPTVARTANQALTAGVGALTLTGFAPTVSQAAGTSLTPGAGALTLTGSAPTVTRTANQALIAAVGTLTLTGPVPTVARTANQAISVGLGSGALTGYAPTVVQASASVSLVPNVGQLTLTGYAPSVGQTGQTKFGGVGKLQHLPRMSWPDKPRAQPKIIQHDPEQSEITPEVHGSNILFVIRAARAKPRAINLDDEDDEIWMLS